METDSHRREAVREHTERSLMLHSVEADTSSPNIAASSLGPFLSRGRRKILPPVADRRGLGDSFSMRPS